MGYKENKLTKRFLEYVNNEQPSLEDSFDYFTTLLKKESLEIRGEGVRTLLFQFKKFFLKNIDILNVIEFMYDLPHRKVKFPLRGRIFKINTPSGNFFLKAYQRKEERIVLDKLHSSPLIAVVDRFGWLFIEKEMTTSNMLKYLNKDPFYCRRIYGQILNEFHKNGITYNDALIHHSYLKRGETKVIDFGLSSLSDPFENDYIQLFIHVIGRIDSEKYQKSLLNGFSQIYYNIDRFNKFRIKKERENLIGRDLFNLFIEGNKRLIPDYFNITFDSIFKDALRNIKY